MRRQLFVSSVVIVILSLLFISCQQREPVQQKKTSKDLGVAVQTYDKAVETMDEYKQKGEEAIEQMKESAAGYGEVVNDAAAGYGEAAEKAVGELGKEVESFEFK